MIPFFNEFFKFNNLKDIMLSLLKYFFGCLPTSHEWYKCSLINGSTTGLLNGKTIENVSNVLAMSEKIMKDLEEEN